MFQAVPPVILTPCQYHAAVDAERAQLERAIAGRCPLPPARRPNQEE